MRLGGQGDLLGIVQEIEVWPRKQLVYAQPVTYPGEWNTKNPMEFWYTNGLQNLSQTTRFCNNKKKSESLPNSGLCCLGWTQNIIERKRKEELVPRPSQRIEKSVEHESNLDTNCNWCSLYSHQKFCKGFGGLGNKKTSGTYSDYCIIKIRQNTEKSPGHLRRLAVTQTPVRMHRLTLGWKTLKTEK